MTHDPFQTNPALGAYSGLATPFQSLYSSLNPVAAFNPLASAYPPIAGIIQQLQLAQMLAARAAVPQLPAASPWSGGLNNPLLASLLQNPLIAATLENPLLAQTQFGAQPHPFNPYLGQNVPQFNQMGSPYGQQMGSPYPQMGSPYQQNGSPYGQIGSPFPQFGSPYPHLGSPYGQIGPMLAPQSWVGQPGFYGSSPLGQVHPLVSQLIGRGLQAGMFPTGL
jgi:hypothetical protein